MSEEKLPVIDDTPHVCKGCRKWSAFGRGCWVFWEGKRACTMYDGADPMRCYNGDLEAFQRL